MILESTWFNPAKTHGTWFQNLMKFRFLMSHSRKNSMRDKVKGKKWVYSDRGMHTPECGPLHRVSTALKFGVGGFYRLGNFIY